MPFRGGEGLVRVNTGPLRSAIRKMDGLITEDERDGILGAVHRDLSTFMSARARAASPPRLQSAISAFSTPRIAAVSLTPTAEAPDALARFFGAKRATGWYAVAVYGRKVLKSGRLGKGLALSKKEQRRQFAGFLGDRRRQFPTWVGNQWQPGDRVGLPYFVGEAMNDAAQEAARLMLDAIEDAVAATIE